MARPAPLDGRVSRNFGLILGSEFVGQAVAFVAGVYLARTLSVQGFGLLVFVSSLVLYLLILVDGGTDVWGTRAVAVNSRNLIPTVKSVGALRLCLGSVVVVFLMALAMLSAPEQRLALLAGITSIVALIMQTNWAHRALESAAPAAGTVLQRLTFLVLVVVFVRSPDQVSTVVLFQGGTELLAALLLLFALQRKLRGLPRGASEVSVAEVVRLAWPFCASRAMRGLPVTAMVAAITWVWHDAQTAYFGSALRVATLLLVVSSAFSMATFPALARANAVGDEAERRTISATFRLHAIMVMPLAAGGMTLAWQVIEFLFTNTYAPATHPLQLLLAAILLTSISDNVRRVLHVRERQYHDLGNVALATCVGLVSAAALLPMYGAVGASSALIVGECALLVLTWQALFRGAEGWSILRRGYGFAMVTSVIVVLVGVISAMIVPFPGPVAAVALAYFVVLWLKRKDIAADLRALEVGSPFGGGAAKLD